MNKIRRQTELTYKRLEEDWDSVVVIDGGEGTGKTTLGLHKLDHFYTLRNGQCVEEDIRHVCLTGEDFKKDLSDLNKREMTIYDEAGELNKRRALSQFNVMMMQTYQVIRGDNLYTVLILPSIFELDSFFAKRRVKGLYHVYRRGRVAYFTQKRVHALIALNQNYPVKNMSLVKCTWRDTFPKYKGVMAESYKKLKGKKMRMIRKSIIEEPKPTKTFYDHTCNMCGYKWKGVKPNPVKCPNDGCQSRAWNKSEATIPAEG